MNIDYLKEIKSQNKRITAKFMSLVENDDSIAIELLKSMYLDENSNTQIIGITGYPGAGKSTILSQLIKYFRGKNQSVGVIAIDPSSPFTGGALLGDRLRMDEFVTDSNVFIRSMASRGRLGGLAPATAAFIKILEYYGCDVVLVETVGTGQSETDIIGMADTVLLVTIPSSGDHIQALKAGVFEIADIFVVNKADLDGKDKQVMFIRQIIELDKDKFNNQWTPPIVETKANNIDFNANGILNLTSEIKKHWEFLINSNVLLNRRKNKIKTELLAILQYYIAQELLNSENGSLIMEAIDLIHEHKLDPYSFIQQFLTKYSNPTSKKEND